MVLAVVRVAFVLLLFYSSTHLTDTTADNASKLRFF